MLTYLLLAAIFLLHQESLACPEGTIEGLTPDVCYFFSIDKLDWLGSEDKCIFYGGHLASVGSAFENNFLQTQAKKAFSDDVTFYLGGSNFYPLEEFNDIDQWNWIDGAPFSYQNFAPGQQPGKHQLGVFYANIQSGQWYSDFNFTETPRYYVCRVPNGKVDCDQGAYYYLNNKCYWIASGVTFSKTTKSCQNNSANLASIHSDLDNTLVTQVTTGLDLSVATSTAQAIVRNNWKEGVEPSFPETMCVIMEGEYWTGGDEFLCEIFPTVSFNNAGICEKAVQVTPVKHVSEMRQEKKLRIMREGLRRRHEKKIVTKKGQI
uniref:C-type lectin domain-containing protein n=1 Tax=Acrobeloides nanus TaxID=290746 RepID=A0A914ED77_9BILA